MDGQAGDSPASSISKLKHHVRFGRALSSASLILRNSTEPKASLLLYHQFIQSPETLAAIQESPAYGESMLRQQARLQHILPSARITVRNKHRATGIATALPLIYLISGDLGGYTGESPAYGESKLRHPEWLPHILPSSKVNRST